jgi:hypothetical protein
METKRLGECWKNEADELGWGNPERLASLQRLVYELLVKNQTLRMELMARRVELETDIHDAMQPVFTISDSLRGNLPRTTRTGISKGEQ